jgi:hypothetical protein
VSTVKFTVYYHEPSDQLGIAGENWDYIVSVAWIPFCRTPSRLNVPDAADAIDFVSHGIAEPLTDEWHVIGEF